MTKDSFIARFTPSLLSADTLEAIFVKRERLAARLVDLVCESALTGNKHYVLLVGPRGIGKTHLVSLVYHRVKRREEAAGRLLVAWLREEEWGVSSFLDLVLRMLRTLHEEYGDKELAAQCEQLRTLSAERAELAAEDLLKRTVGKKTLFVIAENLDEIFSGLGEQGQQKLRAYIQNNPFFTIVGTSQSLFGGVSLRTSPFYGFFETHHLDELAFEDAVSLVVKIAEHQGNEELASAVRTPRGRARIRAVHHLAGGNPRVYVIFSQFLTAESLDRLVDPVVRTLDDLTPYYQARMSYLSPQQRKIVDFLCNRRGAVPVGEIAQENFLTSQTTSGQLRKLHELGYVRSHQLGRESYYELREPLMRLSLEVKKTRGGAVRLLVEFLQLWYSHGELADQLHCLPAEATLHRMYLVAAIESAEEAPEDPTVAACLRDLEACGANSEWDRALAVTEELLAVRGYASDWMWHIHCLGMLDRHAEGIAASERALEQYPGTAILWVGRAFRLGPLGRHQDALACANKAVDLEPAHWYTWLARALVTSAQRRHEEALASWDRALELDSTVALIWSGRAQTLFDLSRHEEALTSLERSRELDPCDWDAGCSLCRATLLMTLGRWEEGVEQLEQALCQYTESLRSEPVSIVAPVRNLLAHTDDMATWRRHISVWVEHFHKHGLLAELGAALAAGVFHAPIVPTLDRVGRSWCDVWQEVAGGYEEMEFPLRVLDAAVEYRARRDERILLALPSELRELFERYLKE